MDQEGYRVPYYHQRGHVAPGKVHSITDGFVPQWKGKRAAEGALFSNAKWQFMTINDRDWNPEKFQQQVKKTRAEIRKVFFHTSSLTQKSSRMSLARGHTSFVIHHYGKVG